MMILLPILRNILPILFGFMIDIIRRPGFMCQHIPAMAFLLKLIEWIGIFLITPLSALFNLLSWGMLIIAILSYLMGLEDGAETIRLIQSAFIVFVIPHVGELLITIVALINILIVRFIMS